MIGPKAGIIIDVQATPVHHSQQVDATATMVARVQKRFGRKPKRGAVDTAHGTGPMFGWLVNGGKFAPQVPLWDKSAIPEAMLGRSAFTFDVDGN